MQFFKSLFSSTQPVIEDPIPQQTHQTYQFQIYFTPSQSEGTFVTITPEMTCEDIIKLYSSNWKISSTSTTTTITATATATEPNYNLDDYEFVIFNSTNIKTGIALKPSTCPFQYLQNKNWNIYYLLKSNRNPKIIKKQTQIEQSSSLPQSSQPKVTNEIIKEGEVFLYKKEKKTFNKKKALLTKSTFSYSKTNKNSTPCIIPVNSIAKIQSGIVESSNELKKQIGDDANNTFELILTNRTIFIFKVKKEIDFALWLECFDNVLMKQYEEQLDSNYNNLIEHYISNIGRTSTIELEKLDDLRQFIKVESFRKMFYTLYKNKQYSDIFESILSYKQNVTSFEFFQSWACFKQLVSILHIEGFKKESEDNRKKLLELVSMEKINQIIALSVNIRELFEKLRTSPSTNDLNETLQPLFPDDLFDEIYHNVIEKCFIPFYEGSEIKALFMQRVSAVLSTEFEKENKYSLHKYYLLGIDDHDTDSNK